MGKDLIEIRCHGREGQFAKNAAFLFGEAASDFGMYIQAFPGYGPERTGATVKSFNHLCKKEIRIHSGITNPNIVFVHDPSLMKTFDVLKGLERDGILIVNTQRRIQTQRCR